MQAQLLPPKSGSRLTCFKCFRSHPAGLCCTPWPGPRPACCAVCAGEHSASECTWRRRAPRPRQEPKEPKTAEEQAADEQQQIEELKEKSLLLKMLTTRSEHGMGTAEDAFAEDDGSG